jgi:hypothetical protein
VVYLERLTVNQTVLYSGEWTRLINDTSKRVVQRAVVTQYEALLHNLSGGDENYQELGQAVDVSVGFR